MSVPIANATEALSALIERGESPSLTTNLVSRLGDVVALFERKEWLVRAPKAVSLRCRLCDSGHDADVIFDEKTKQGRYWCVASGGWAEADDADLETRVLALATTVAALRAALAPIEFALREEIPDILWRLGDSKRCGFAWTALLARSARNDNLALIAARLTRISTRPTLVLTTSPLSRSFELSGFRFAPLAAIMDLDVDGRFLVNDGAIRAALGLAREGRPRRGRPPHLEEEALAVVASASRDELALDDETLVRLVASRVPGLARKNRGVIASSLRASIIQQANARCAELGLAR